MMEQRDARDVLVVGWFPALDDASAGRFIADQVTALRATGRVHPTVATFEAVPLFGDLDRADSQAEATRLALGPAIRVRRDAWSTPAAHGPTGIPVARLAIVAGETRTTLPTHQADHRTAALLELAGNPGSRRPALIHGHVGYPEGLAAARLARRLGVPFVLTEHATYLDRLLGEPGSRAGYVEAAGAARRIIAVTRILADQLVAELPDVGPKVRVIPNTVAVDEFRLVGPADRDPDELLWVGYRRAVKGIDTLLRAFAIVRAGRPMLRLRLVGRSPTAAEEQAWEQLAGELGVRDAVRFDPPADRAEVADAMTRAALFVHPSTRETFGVVAVEALASGLPVVACDSGGVTEVLGPDPAALGALVPPSDPATLAAAIEATLERRMSIDPAALRAYAVARFGATAVAGRIADLYDEVLDEEAPGVAGQSAGVQDAGPDRIAGASKTIVVGCLRGQLDRALAGVPSAFAASLTVATTGAATTAAGRTVVAEPGTERLLARWIRPGGQGGGRGGGRLRSLGTSMLATLPGRVGRARWAGREAAIEPDLLRRLRSAIEDAIDISGEGPPDAVGLSGVDHLALAPFVAAGRVRATPGSLRWLGDRWWSERAATVGPSPEGQPGIEGEAGEAEGANEA